MEKRTLLELVGDLEYYKHQIELYVRDKYSYIKDRKLWGFDVCRERQYIRVLRNLQYYRECYKETCQKIHELIPYR